MPSHPCPQCTLDNTYVDGDHRVCADCGFEWPVEAAAGEIRPSTTTGIPGSSSAP